MAQQPPHGLPVAQALVVEAEHARAQLHLRFRDEHLGRPRLLLLVLVLTALPWRGGPYAFALPAFIPFHQHIFSAKDVHVGVDARL